MSKPKTSRGKPVWGRAALLVFLGSLLLTYMGTASNVLPGAAWALCLLLVIAAGIVLPIVSLAKRERRAFAVVTLVMSLGLPFAVWAGFSIFFSFFYIR